MTSVELNNNVNCVNEQTNKRNIKGSMAAAAGGAGVTLVSGMAGKPFLDKMIRQSNSLTQDEINLVNEAADNVCKNISKLSDKGVKINNITPETFEVKHLKQALGKWAKPLTNMIPILAIAKGKNACFSPVDNSVIINRNKLPLGVFHEMGHAHNFNNTKLWKAIQITRNPLIYIGTALAFLPAFTKKQTAAEGEELTKEQKNKNAIRNSAPIVAAAAFLPTIMEEGMATVKGNKWAKQVLSPELFKKVVKLNKFGFAGYVITAVGLGLASLTAKVIKDHSDSKKAAQNIMQK